MQYSLPTADLIVLLVYFGVVILLGIRFAGRSRQTEEFMAAGRSLPGWVVGLSIFGTYVSSISFLANPGKSYQGNWNPFVFSLSLPLAAWIAARWFIPYYRASREISAYSHLEHRFGPWARSYAAICYLLTQFARVGSILYLVALAISPLLGWDIVTVILVTGSVVTLYTILGGIEAVIWTDVLQSVVLAAGLLVSVGILLATTPGGPAELFQVAWQADKFGLGGFSTSLAEPTFWVVLVYGLVINLQNFGIDQSYVQRFHTARSGREAVRSVWLGTQLYLPISALLFFVGTGLFVFYSLQPGLLPPEASLKPDAVFPYFIVHQVPLGLTGLLLAAILAAAMSSVDSSLNSSATLILCDFYKRYFRPSAGERESMGVLYGSTLLWGATGTLTALAMIRVQSVLDAWWQLSGVLSGGMLGLFLLGLISRKAGNAEAVTAVVVGVLVIFWMTVSPSQAWPESLAYLKSPFHGFMTTVVGTLGILLVGLLLSRWRRSGRSPDRGSGSQ